MSEMLLTAYDGAILGPIAKLLGWLMNGVYYLMLKIGLDNVGLSIIIFTIIIYMLLFPITYKQQKFSKLSQKMQPEINAIQKKYKDKKDQASMMAMQEETQAVYQKYGISMMGNCVSMLVQALLLFALYRVFLNIPAYVTSVKESFSGLVNGIMSTAGYQDKMTELMTNLKIYTSPAADFTATDATAISNSIVDVVYKLNSSGWDTLKETFPSLTDVINTAHEQVSHATTFLCYNISDTPLDMIRTNFSNHAFMLVIAALAIPVISYLTQVLSMKMMPATSSGSGEADQAAKQMQMMNKFMPVVSFIICFTVPVGLGIYWIASALVRAGQQFALNKYFEKVNLEDIIKKNQAKARKKREKMGISQNQISNAAKLNTKQIAEPVNNNAEKEMKLEKANSMKTNAKPSSMAAKANMVKEFNERNSKK